MSPGYHLSDSSGPAALRRILYAYSVYDSEVVSPIYFACLIHLWKSVQWTFLFIHYHGLKGYCQGMNFIAAMFLTFLPEEESFWMLVGKFTGKWGAFCVHLSLT